MPTFVKNGDAGYTETGAGWVDDGSGATSYGNVTTRVANGGTGANTAKWAFTGLSAGTGYRLSMSFPGGGANASNTPFQILDSDGTTVLASGTLNQSLGAGQAASKNLFDVGFFWAVLSDGIFPTGTSVTVKITDAANNYVAANAVRLDTAAPTTISVTAQSSSSVSLSWSAATIATVAANGYRVQRAPDAGGTPGTYANIGSAQSATTLADATVSANGCYWYRVNVTFTNGQTVASNAVYAGAASAATGEVRYRGTLYAFPPPYASDDNDYGPTHANDDDFTTFAALSGSPGYVAFDLGTAVVPTAALLSPRVDFENQSAATFAGATTQFGTYATLGSNAATPLPAYTNTEIPLPGSTPYRFLKCTLTIANCSEFGFVGAYAVGLNSAEAMPPVATPPAGRKSTAQTVTLASRTTNASIYYTTDGTTPNVINGVAQGTTTLYSGALSISSTTTLKAIAVHPTVQNSRVASFYYTTDVLRPLDPNLNDVTTGQLIQAHDGSILYANGFYWWYGHDARNGSGVSQNYILGIRLYRSIDLLNWTDMGIVVTTAAATAVDPLASSLVRPHVIYNALTQKYVMWCNALRTNNSQYAVVSTASSPQGPWTVVSSSLVNSTSEYGDACLLLDDDGTGYVAYSDPQIGHTREIYVTALSADFLSTAGSRSLVNGANGDEGTCFFKSPSGKYHVWGGGAAFYVPNGTNDFVADTPLGTYTGNGNPFQASGSADQSLSYGTQASHVFRTATGQTIYFGDGWNGPGGPLYQSTYLFLPVTFPTATTSSISYAATFTPDAIAPASGGAGMGIAMMDLATGGAFGLGFGR